MDYHRMGLPPPTITLHQIEQSPDYRLCFEIQEPVAAHHRCPLEGDEGRGSGCVPAPASCQFFQSDGKKITAVRLQFRHAPLRRTVHAEMYHLDLEPHGSFSTDRMPGKSAQRFLHGGYRLLPPRNLMGSDPAKRVFHPYVIYFPVEKTPRISRLASWVFSSRTVIPGERCRQGSRPLHAPSDFHGMPWGLDSLPTWTHNHRRSGFG